MGDILRGTSCCKSYLNTTFHFYAILGQIFMSSQSFLISRSIASKVPRKPRDLASGIHLGSNGLKSGILNPKLYECSRGKRVVFDKLQNNLA